MIDEVLFMEMRLFSDFCKNNKISAKEANRIFNQYRIWEYIESCYDSLHLNGDDVVLNDIDMILNRNGVSV